MNIWGIHMPVEVGLSPLQNNYVGIGWNEIGDLTLYENSRELLKKALLAKFPDNSKGTIAANAGVLYRFVNEVALHDIIIYPSKINRTINIGRVMSEYTYVADGNHDYPNQRYIKWLGSFPRRTFSQPALSEVGAFVTLFSVWRHRDEFLKKVNITYSANDTSETSGENKIDDQATA